MSGRGHRQNHHGGCQGEGLPSFFEERPSPLDKSRKGLLAANPLIAPSSDKEVHFDDEIFKEIKDYMMEEEWVQASDPPYICLHRTSSGRSERVHPGAPSLQPVEPYLRTLTYGISIRTGSLVSLTRS